MISSSSSSEPTLKDGPLSKRGAGIWWKTRYFRLTASELIVADIKQQSLIARIPAKQIVLCQPLKSNKTRRNSSRRFIIRLIDGTVLNLSAPTEADCVQWVFSVNGVIAVCDRQKARDRLELQKQRELGQSQSLNSIVSNASALIPSPLLITSRSQTATLPSTPTSPIIKPIYGQSNQSTKPHKSVTISTALNDRDRKRGQSPLQDTMLQRSNSAGGVKDGRNRPQIKIQSSNHKPNGQRKAPTPPRAEDDYEIDDARRFDDWYDFEDDSPPPILQPHYQPNNYSYPQQCISSSKPPTNQILFYLLLITAFSLAILMPGQTWRTWRELNNVAVGLRPANATANSAFRAWYLVISNSVRVWPLLSLVCSVAYLISHIASISNKPGKSIDYAGGLVAIFVGSASLFWAMQHVTFT